MPERADGPSSEDRLRAARDNLGKPPHTGLEPDVPDQVETAQPPPTMPDLAPSVGSEDGDPAMATGPAFEPSLPSGSPPPPPDRQPWYKERWLLVVVGIVGGVAGVLISRGAVSGETPTEGFLGGIEEQYSAAGVSDESWDCVVEEMEAGGYLDGFDDLTDAEVALLADMEFTEGFASAPPAVQRAMEGVLYSMIEAGCVSGRELELLSTTPLVGGGQVGEPSTFGDDPSLDLLWSECDSGDLVGCDILYSSAPIGSDYDDFAATCGGRNEALGIDDAYCIQLYDAVDLDALRAACADGDFGSCDLLFYVGPLGSDYEAFGGSCGGLDPSGQQGFCLMRRGLGNR